MIADIFKCPQCGVNVYLAEDETHCPLCGATKRRYMKKKRQGVDLAADFALGENARYAHFRHLCDILSHQYGDRMGLYANDCWKYAWDATKTDMANAEKLNAFLDNPNGFIFGKDLSNFDLLQKEIERTIILAMSRAKMPLDRDEWDKFDNERVSFDPDIRIFVDNNLRFIKAFACYKKGLEYKIPNYLPVEKYENPPLTAKNCRVFQCQYQARETTAVSRKKDVPKWAHKVATGIARCYYPKPSLFARIRSLISKNHQCYAQV